MCVHRKISFSFRINAQYLECKFLKTLWHNWLYQILISKYKIFLLLILELIYETLSDTLIYFYFDGSYLKTERVHIKDWSPKLFLLSSSVFVQYEKRYVNSNIKSRTINILLLGSKNVFS